MFMQSVVIMYCVGLWRCKDREVWVGNLWSHSFLRQLIAALSLFTHPRCSFIKRYWHHVVGGNPVME